MDLTFQTPEGRFNYRVGALIYHKGRLLAARNDEAPYCYSVGGRVKYGESSTEAVAREVFEETGVRLKPVRPVFMQEQFFTEQVTGERFHEIGVYWLMEDSPDLDRIVCRSVTERGVAEEMFWLDPARAEESGFVPKSIARRLMDLPEVLTPVVERDGEGS